MITFKKWHPIYFSLIGTIYRDLHKNTEAKNSRRCSCDSWNATTGACCEFGRATLGNWPLYFALSIFVALVFFMLISTETTDEYPDKRTLEIDGYRVIRESNHKKVLNELPPNYVFLDYEYIIRGCSLSTFHRDVTSSPYIYGTTYPVYTYIEYANESEAPLLSVCPASHTSTPFLYSAPVIITGKGKTGVLFHCDLVHAGAINTLGKSREAIQYKIAHKTDIPKLAHLQNVRMEKNGSCDISPFYEYASRRMSWMFSHIVNHHFTTYLQDRPDTHVGKMLLSLYGREFYNK